MKRNYRRIVAVQVPLVVIELQQGLLQQMFGVGTVLHRHRKPTIGRELFLHLVGLYPVDLSTLALECLLLLLLHSWVLHFHQGFLHQECLFRGSGQVQCRTNLECVMCRNLLGWALCQVYRFLVLLLLQISQRSRLQDSRYSGILSHHLHLHQHKNLCNRHKQTRRLLTRDHPSQRRSQLYHRSRGNVSEAPSFWIQRHHHRTSRRRQRSVGRKENEVAVVSCCEISSYCYRFCFLIVEDLPWN